MRAVIVVTDLLARSRLQEAAAAAGYEVSVRRQVPGPEEAPPDVLVVDLDLPGALEGVTVWRRAHPGPRVVGFAFHEEGELIERARGAGIEVVPHGATARPARIFF